MTNPIQDTNPYAPPKANLQKGDTASLKLIDGRIFVPVDADFPKRCVKCNASINTTIKPKNFYWHNPAWYLLLLINVLLYIVAGLIVRKKVKLTAGLCEAHQKQRHKRMAAWGLAAVIFILLAFFSLNNNSLAWLTLGSFIASLVSLVGIAMTSRTLAVTKITAEGSYFKGAGTAFLDSLR